MNKIRFKIICYLKTLSLHIVYLMRQFLIYILSLFCLCLIVQARENILYKPMQNNPIQLIDSVNKRPTVGIVLSGGGAKGLAHIGVLKALEENNIQIDYIAGTSMGAIIGGLYASGYSVDSIERIFYSEELNRWLSSEIDNQYKYYFQIPKIEPTLFRLNFEIDKKLKPELPMSLIDPVQMDYAFMQFFTEANELCKGDYSHLMIPFLCIASNVSEKKQSVQRSGNLGRSIRASMTFPLFFSPITIDGDIMCDGGVYNNFPSKEMQEYYHPDVMIGVKVVDNFSTPNEEDLVLYVENMMTSISNYELPETNSLMLEPNMKSVDIMDFTKQKNCILQGYDNTIANINKIKELIPNLEQESQIRKKRDDFNNRKRKHKIGNIIVHGVDDATKDHFEKILTMGIHNDSITLEDLKANYLNFASLPNITSIKPDIYYDNFIRSYVLDLNVKTKNLLRTKIGGMLSTDPISNMFIGLEYDFYKHFSYTLKTNYYIGRYYSSAMFYFRMGFPNKVLPYYLETEMNFNKWNYFRSRNGLFEYSANNYLIQRENNLQMRFVFPTSRRGKMVLKVGVGHMTDKYFNTNAIIASDINDVSDFFNFATALSNDYNTLDDYFYPTQGFQNKLNVQFVTGKEEFKERGADNNITQNHTWMQASYKFKYYNPINRRYSIGVQADVYYSSQDLFFTRKASLLAAGIYAPTQETMTRFYQEYRANQYLAGGLENCMLLGTSFFGAASVRLGTYLFVPVKQILSNDNNQPYYGEMFQKVYFISSLAFVLSTRVGNLSLSASYTQRDNNLSPWNFSVSFGKIIFNNRNIDN